MSKLIGFGEIMMRLNPPNELKLVQTNTLEMTFGGTEFNVLASASKFGLNTEYVTVLSHDMAGEAALAYILKNNVGSKNIIKQNNPLGVFFLEVGSGARPSVISYNRSFSAFSQQELGIFNWSKIIEKEDSLHWTGITPAISKNAKENLKSALEVGKKLGIERYVDPTYRSNLWNYGERPELVLGELVGLSTVFLGGIDEINLILSKNYSRTKEDFISASKELMATFKELKMVVEKIRGGKSASCQEISSRAWDGKEYIETNKIVIEPVLDRIGTGDAWAAAFIYGLEKFELQMAMAFADAACALKHTIRGDVNLSSESEVLAFLNGDTQGRIRR